MAKDLLTNEIDFLNYFKNPGLFDELNLVESGALKLHWSNWNQLLFSIQKKVKNGAQLDTSAEVAHLLNQYKDIEVWMKNKNGSIKTNLFDLYSYYLDPRLRELWFDLNEDTLLSFKCASGPFIRLQSMRWFNFEIYKFFVFQRLLNNEGPVARSFRISTHLPLKCEFPNSVLDALTATIVQISKNGFLMKVDSKSDLHSLKVAENVTFYANLNPFILSYGKGIVESCEIFNDDVFKNHNKLNYSFRLKENILKLRNNTQNLNYSNGNEYYLFISLDDIEESSQDLIKRAVVDTVTKYEEHSLSLLKKIA